MSKCTCHDKTTLEGIVTEILAGMILSPQTREHVAFNEASNRAVNIIRKYQRGECLFQICPEHGAPKK